MSSYSHLIQLILVMNLALITTTAAQQPFARCSRTGFTCDSTCKYLGVCTRPNDGDSYTWTQVRNCFEQHCDPSTASCSDDPGVCIKELSDVVCSAPGRYPDTSDCTVYYDCNPETGTIIYRCPAGTRYNPCTEKCDLTLVNNTCPEEFRTCSTDNQGINVIPGNKAIYYYCIEISPSKFKHVMNRCSKGTYYDEDTKTCTENLGTECSKEETGGNGNESIADSPSEDTTAGDSNGLGENGDTTGQSGTNGTSNGSGGSADGTGEGGSGNGEGGNGTGSGNKICKSPGLTRDTTNCAAYYFCTPTLQAVHVDCTQGFYFAPEKGGCVKGTCENGAI